MGPKIIGFFFNFKVNNGAVILNEEIQPQTQINGESTPKN